MMLRQMIIAGVNGGGTDTEVICCDEKGRVVGKGISGPSNYHNIGIASTMASIRKALKAAGAQKPDHLCVALAAINSDSDFNLLSKRLQEEYPGALLEHDAYAELYIKTRGAPGVIAISGTGSVVLGYDGRKRHRRCDMGWLLGDDASGYYIGKEGLRAAARMIFEEQEETPLKNHMLDHLSLKNPDELMKWAYSDSGSVANIAGAAIAVNKAANLADTVAISILERASTYLADNAISIAKSIGVKHVYMKGGVFRFERFRQNFTKRLGERGLDSSEIIQPPALGSLLIAADRAGVDSSKWKALPA